PLAITRPCSLEFSTPGPILCLSCLFSFFLFNDTAPTEIYPLSLHDALPILTTPRCGTPVARLPPVAQIHHSSSFTPLVVHGRSGEDGDYDLTRAMGTTSPVAPSPGASLPPR